MKIEVYNSVGGAPFFQRLVEEWRWSGSTVGLHEAISEEDYRDSRGVISRLLVRWKMYGGFAWSSWRAVRQEKSSDPIRLVTTNPFFAPALVSRAARGRGATINLLYDLYPEALIQAGKTRPDSWLAGRCAAITRYALRECAVTVFLGEHLRAYTESTHGPARRAEIIPVGADGAPFKDFPPQPIPTYLRPRILYCGQMGRMHEVDTLISAWGSPEAAGCEWVFHASGAGYARLQLSSNQVSGLKLQVSGGLSPTVTWGKALPDAEWVEVMKQAQVALVTVAPGAERVVMPSKTYSALVAGQAVLAICPLKSDLADLVRKHDCGWIVEPGDVVGLSAVLHEIATNPAMLQAKRERAFSAGHTFYDSAVVAKQWLALFTQLLP